MRRVAKAVGLTPMALYRHYRDRAALLNALANQGFEELTSQLTARTVSETSSSGSQIEKRLAQTLDIFLDYALAHPRLFELMFLKPREGARTFPGDFKMGRSPTANLTVKLLQQGMDSGYFRADDAWEIAFETGALWQGLIILYFGGRMGMSRDEFRSFCRRSFRRYMHGIRAQ